MNGRSRADCINFDIRKRICEALERGTHCNPDNCVFFQTPDQAARSYARAHARLRSLSEKQQDYIAEKYYNGKKPWLDTPPDETYEVPDETYEVPDEPEDYETSDDDKVWMPGMEDDG